MIIDSSALVAILRGEPDGPRLTEIIAAAEACCISAGTYLETAIVVDAMRDVIASRRLDQYLERADIRIAPVTETQVRIARAAYRDFGRGSGHPAGLNFGACFAYALAKEIGEPLLYQGTDFSHTDVEPA